MNRNSLISLAYPVFNAVVVLGLSNAIWNAFHAHDFIPLALLGVVATAYAVGLLLYVVRADFATTVNQRLTAGGIYLLAAFTTDTTVEESLFASSASGYHFSGWSGAIINASLIGSLLLGLAFLSVLIKPKYGNLVALVGASLAWPYFAYLAWHLPWRDFVWLVTIHSGGKLEVMAVFSLLAATIYSTFRLRFERENGWGIRSRAN